jgi:hypothetical protein
LEPAWYSVGPEHRMGIEFGTGTGGDDAEEGEGEGSEDESARRKSAAALTARLKRMLELEGVVVNAAEAPPPAAEEEAR